MTRFNVALAGICMLGPGACATPNFHFEGLAAIATALIFLVLAAASRPHSRLKAMLAKRTSLA
jgi:hypothetical protein